MRHAQTYAPLMAPMLAAAALTAPAQACDAPLYDPKWRDGPGRGAADCSFTDADEFPGQTISASRAQTIGNGLLGQVVTVYQACGIYQTLMVVDCNTTETLMIEAPEGNPPVSFGGSNNREIKDLYAPRGKLQLRKTDTVSRLQARAASHGYKTTTDVAGRIAQMKKHNRYNPFCGCGLFHPDSAGAERAKTNATGRPVKKG